MWLPFFRADSAATIASTDGLCQTPTRADRNALQETKNPPANAGGCGFRGHREGARRNYLSGSFPICGPLYPGMVAAPYWLFSWQMYSSSSSCGGIRVAMNLKSIGLV
jgi:hypothetical protein